jgi:hypothetical protein
MATCAIWPGRRGLVAVVVDEDGRPSSRTVVARTEEACWALLCETDATTGLDWELVLPDWLARSAGIAQLALARGVAVWVVPSQLAEAVRIIGHLGTGPPARIAAALARIPLAPVLRGHLRRLEPPSDKRQLPLL